MRTLIVYYSYTGNNKLLANYLRDKIGSDIYAIEEKANRSNFTIFLDMLFQRTPPIYRPSINLNQFEHVIFMGPVWGGKIASPLKAYIKHEKDMIPDYSFISLCTHDRENQKEKLKEQLSELVGKDPGAIFELKIVDLFPFPEKKSALSLIRYRLSKPDLIKFQDQIDEILDFYNTVFGIDLKEGAKEKKADKGQVA